MGLFSSSIKVPQLDLTKTKEAVANIADFGDVFGSSLARSRDIAPLALGARESALGDLSQGLPFFQGFQTADFGEVSPDFFSQFQPTSFEEGIAGSFFEDALRRARRTAGQRASLAGIESAFPEIFSRAISPTISNIGEFLANQGQKRAELALGRQRDLAELGQRRAETSLQSRLNIDPFRDILLPQTRDELAQSNLKQNALAELAFIDAQESLRSKVGKQQNRSELFRNISRLVGPLPALFAGEGGAALGGFTDNLNLAGNILGLGDIGGTPFQSQQGTPSIGTQTSKSSAQPVFRFT